MSILLPHRPLGFEYILHFIYFSKLFFSSIFKTKAYVAQAGLKLCC